MLAQVRRLVRTAVRGTARDDTTACAGRSALVLAPHPDDETLGCGAAIRLKVTAGTPVTVAVLTDGRHSHHSRVVTPDRLAELRRTEMAEAARRLGLSGQDVRWGGFIDGALAEHEDEAVRFVDDLLEELNPQEVYTTCAAEPHPDHASLARVARRSVTGYEGECQLLEYPIWLWRSWPVQRGDRLRSTMSAAATVLGRRAVKVRTAGHLPAKLHALQAHASQLSRPAAVPADEEWEPLPPAVIDAASDTHELFLPWPRGARAARWHPVLHGDSRPAG